ncbi:MAG: hypothetical protein J6T88_02670 [Bacteroidales bacterium]|nr:hypothetical protein [Bacteroidales bacterium]
MKQQAIPQWITYGILFISSVLFIFFFSTTTSPLFRHYPFWFYGDSGVFREMGLCLLNGNTPYVDLFDHKGPVLWFIQALGIWISQQWGLMLLQSISLFCTLLIWFKTSLILCRKQIPSLITVIIILIFLLAFYEHGNLCEEWSLPFISLPIFLYIKRWETIKDEKTPIFIHIDTFILGLCVGILAMIRLNNTAPIIGFALWHIIRCIQEKEYKRMWADMVLIIGGAFIIFIFCSAFYLIKAGWSGVFEMIYGTFIFNFEYNSLYKHQSLDFLRNYIIPIGFMVITLICFFNNKSFFNINVPLTLSYIFTFFSMGSQDYGHYMMIFIPLFVITFCLVVNNRKKWIYFFPLLLIILSIHRGYDAADYLLFRLKGKTANNTELKEGFYRFITSIKPEERTSIYNSRLEFIGSSLFADENICQCNRIIYQRHYDISSRLQEYEKTHGIKALQPAWILTQSSKPEASDEYMQTHYTLADSIPGGQFDPIWCWKKIDEHN